MKHQFAVLYYKNSSILIESEFNYLSDSSFIIFNYNLDFQSDFTDIVNKGYVTGIIKNKEMSKEARFCLTNKKYTTKSMEGEILEVKIEAILAGCIKT